MVNVTVTVDPPPPDTGYAPLGGEPAEAGVYEFRLERPDVPGSGAFNKIDTIALQRSGPAEFKGSKTIAKIKGTMCVGYPPVNFIDEKACVTIDQSKSQATVVVRYWKLQFAIGGR